MKHHSNKYASEARHNKQRLFRAMCLNKRMFANKRLADDVVEFMHSKGSSNLHSYLCDFCGRWHTGHVR